MNDLAIIPSSAFLEVEVEGSVLEPRQEMTAVFYSIIADTAYHAKGYTQTVDMAAVSLSGDYYDLNNLPEIGSIAQQDSAQINIKVVLLMLLLLELIVPLQQILLRLM